jgi:hypothetical protein
MGSVEISDYERHEENRMEAAPTAKNDSSKLNILSNAYSAQRADFKNLSWPYPNPESFLEIT